MITILIVAILGVVVALVCNRRKIKKGVHEDGFDRKFRIFIYAILAFGIGLIFANVLGSFLTYRQAIFCEIKELVIFRDNCETSGNFFLGIGSQKNQRYYEFLYNKDGQIKYGRLPIDTPLYKIEGKEGAILSICQIEKKFIKPWYKWFTFSGVSEKEYKIFVPEKVLENLLR